MKMIKQVLVLSCLFLMSNAEAGQLAGRGARQAGSTGGLDIPSADSIKRELLGGDTSAGDVGAGGGVGASSGAGGISVAVRLDIKTNINNCHGGDSTALTNGDGNTVQQTRGDCTSTQGRTGESRNYTFDGDYVSVPSNGQFQTVSAASWASGNPVGLAFDFNGRQAHVLVFAEDLTEELAAQEGKDYQADKSLFRIYSHLGWAGQRPNVWTERFSGVLSGAASDMDDASFTVRANADGTVSVFTGIDAQGSNVPSEAEAYKFEMNLLDATAV
ncbi:MAG: hypothetical protein WD055_00390 [Candidatus Dependentiae bacterium]